MTIDKSLKIKAGAIKTRNVYTRAERVTKLKELERFSEGRKRRRSRRKTTQQMALLPPPSNPADGCLAVAA